MDSSVEAVEYLARSDHRVRVLDALVEGPRTRRELRAATGASPPTMGRVLGDFEHRKWVVRDGSTYELTRLGAFVAERFADLRDAMELERTLRDVWEWLPVGMEGFSVELFSDAVVSYPGPGYPYQPVERVTQLIEETSAMRGFGTTVLKSSNLETACRSILGGMEYEFVYSPSVLETVVAWNPSKVAAATACDNCTILLHDALPDAEWCGIGIYDDRVGICCHDVETGVLRAVVDTESVAAREWAETVYERYRREARPLDETDLAASPNPVA